MAKALFESLGVTPIEYRIDLDSSKFEEMVRRVPTGFRTVPQIFIGDDHVGGYEKLEQLHQSGELKTLLGIV